MKAGNNASRVVMGLAYAVLAGIILGPLLRPGYVLALDMVFTPHIPMPSALTSSYLFHAALHVLNVVLPGDVVEKLVLFAAFWLAGVGIHRLTRAFQRGAAYDRLGAYFAGACYAVNPFTYDRLMAGQYSVLMGYALLPFFARSLLAMLRAPAHRAAVRVGLWATLISIISIHTLGVMAVLAAAGVLGVCWQRRAFLLEELWKSTSIALGWFAALNCYWLVPLVLGRGATAVEINSFGARDTTAFATTGWGVPGKFANVLHLQGFWAEDRGLFALPQSRVGGLWGELSVLLAVIIIVGMIWAWRARRRFVLVLFGSCMVAGVLLSLGVLTRLMRHMPLLDGYREPQKFEMLTALSYALFAGFGFSAIVRRTCHLMQSKMYAGGAAAVLFGVPFIFTSTLLWGTRGQLAARAYPADWAAANKLLSNDTDSFQTLFLPWHLYMYFGFAGRIVSSPATAFFAQPVIVSDDPEFNGAAPVQSTAAKRALDQLLPQASKQTALGAQLAKLHIKYVLLARDDDYQKYDYLNHQIDVKQIFAGRDLVLYRNEDFR